MSVTLGTAATPKGSVLAEALRVGVAALRTGARYGAKVRAPHALVMTLLFGKDRSPLAVAQRVVALAWEHASHLGAFAAAYKFALVMFRAAWRYVAMARGAAGVEVTDSRAARGWTGAAAGALAAWLVWRGNTSLNLQILLYLVSRLLLAALRSAASAGTPPFSWFSFPAVYPLLAVGVWSGVMALYEADPGSLHPSLLTSMQEIYGAADREAAAGVAVPAPAP
jgi:peroxisomal membrane protein 4